MNQNPGYFEWRPQLSVVIPMDVYGTEGYKLINSFIDQTSEHLEVLLITSQNRSENEEKLRASLKDNSRVLLFDTHQESKRAYRQFALENANGTYIYFASNRDLLLPKNLLRFVKRMHETGTELARFCNSSGQKRQKRLNKAFQKTETTEPFDGQDLLVDMMVSGVYSPDVSQYLYRRSFLQNIQRTASNLYTTEDEFYTIWTLCSADRTLFLTDEYTMISEKMDSLTNQFSIAEKVNGWSSAVSWLLKFVEKYPLKEMTKKVILQRATELGHELVEIIHRLNKEKNLSLSIDHYFTRKELSQLGYGIRIKNLYPGLYSLLDI